MEKYIDYIEEIQKASKNDKLVFFVGAGVSLLSEYPSWTELVNKFYTKLYKRKKRKKFTYEECLQIPEQFLKLKGQKEFDKIIKSTFNVEKEPNIVHSKMLLLNPAHFLTTNYDELIEKACNNRGKYYSVISSDVDVAYASSSKYILKCHGDFSNGYSADNIVLMDEDYLNYENKFALTSNLMKSIMSTHTIVFIGYGLADYNIKIILNWVKKLQKDGYRKPFFIKVDEKPIDKSMKIYYEEKGLRIIEACDICDTKSSSYSQRYIEVLDMIIYKKKYNFIKNKNSKKIIDLMYEKIESIAELPYIRKKDLKYKFDNKYTFEATGVINYKGSTQYDHTEFDYINELYNVDKKELDMASREKYELVMEFFNNSGIIGPLRIVEGRRISATISLNNPVYHCDYKMVRELINEKVASLNDKYKKAYFLASMGKVNEAYNLYSEILVNAKKEKQWLLHYFAQINRYRLYQSIKITKLYQSDFCSYGFYSEMKVEMEDYKIQNIFDSMPIEFKSNYEVLKVFCEEDYLASEKTELFERISKFNEYKRKNSFTITISSVPPATLTHFELNDNLRFLYENFLWVTRFKEVKEYIKNSIIFMFESYEYESSRVNDPYDLPIPKQGSNFYIDYYDFVNICKSMKIEDIDILKSRCKIKSLKFSDQDKIEKYILRITDELLYQKNNGYNIYFYLQFIEEAKTAVYFSRYIRFSNEVYEEIVNAILFTIPGREVVGNGRFQWLNHLFADYSMPESIIPIIEKYLLNKNSINEKSNEYSLFANLINYHFKDYKSVTLSSFVLELDKCQEQEIKCMYRLSKILNSESKSYIIKMKEIITIRDVMDSFDMGIINTMNDYSDIIIDFIENQFNQIKKDLQGPNKVYKGYSNYPLDIAIRYFVGDFNDSRMESLLGTDDQFDLFVSPSTFDYEKFQIGWLKYYSYGLLKDMSANEYIRPHMLKKLKDSKESKYREILIHHFLK
ncbi:MAG: SIR2 family protein [Firmicutes bacterium]|jgi:NAD-dependent SIR2 family protein deacetylase|nr:SIR2 family protein [Bacillota bacterium]